MHGWPGSGGPGASTNAVTMRDGCWLAVPYGRPAELLAAGAAGALGEPLRVDFADQCSEAKSALFQVFRARSLRLILNGLLAGLNLMTGERGVTHSGAKMRRRSPCRRGYGSPSSCSRVLTSLSTRPDGSGSSIAKCRDPFVL
jgi:hypothetical protein